ncbi:MAG: MGMT family protein [Halioglobus sp.]
MASEPKNETNLLIWQVISMIPEGKVSTYGDVAKHAGLAKAARRVGMALRGLPEDTRIPWHRVINSQGRISLPEGTASYYKQRERLESEGVIFKQNNKVDFRKYRWVPGE